MASKFLFRADGNTRIGLGHLYRTLSVMEFLINRGGSACLATQHCPPPLVHRFQNLGARLFPMPDDLPETEQYTFIRKAAAAGGSEAVITDIWPITAETVRGLRQELHPLPLVCMDSGCLEDAVADVVIKPVLTHCGSAGPSGGERFYEGAAYFPLRSSLLSHAQMERSSPVFARKVAITMGGGDAKRATSRILEYLRKIQAEIEVCAIVGPAYPSLEELQAEHGSWATIISSTFDPGAVFSEVDLCICAGGFTLYELAFLGVPVMAVAVEEHQLKTINAFESSGAVAALGRVENLDEVGFLKQFRSLAADAARRREMSKNGKRLVDGRGTERIAEILFKL